MKRITSSSLTRAMRYARARIAASLVLAFCALSTTLAQTRIYVSPLGEGTRDGQSWANTMPLADALIKAGNAQGCELWLRGYKSIEGIEDAKSKLYFPATQDGFEIPAGTQVYGGFAGTETSVTDRAVTNTKKFQLEYATILTGDLSRNDQVDETNLYYPANTTRQDNAHHVVVIAGGTGTTLLNGLTISSGHAHDTGNNQGGGLYANKQVNLTVEQCFFTLNSAYQGSAIYIGAQAKGTINVFSSVVYNNCSGTQDNNKNMGAVFLEGSSTMAGCIIVNNYHGGILMSNSAKVINCNVVGNSAGAIDLTAAGSGTQVQNTVVWNNTAISTDFRPRMTHCAYNATALDTGDQNCILLHDKNLITSTPKGPNFYQPSLNVGYDFSYNWAEGSYYPLYSYDLLRNSPLIDAAHSSYWPDAAGNTDIMDDAREQGNGMDIGAYEYTSTPSNRIRYVTQDGAGNKDGSSWDNAMDNIQAAIDNLYNNGASNKRGEVWVAKGTYHPTSEFISGNANSTTFIMRDGISVYGGFAGTETGLDQRARKAGGMPWEFVNETVLQGFQYSGANDAPYWNDTDKLWTLSSASKHVVWFAPAPGGAEFKFMPTALNGVIIEGGYALGETGLDAMLPYNGAGVYLNGRNNIMTECVVRYCRSRSHGGGVWLKGAQMSNCLIYNCSSEMGNGGGVFVDNMGFVSKCMIANCSANNGGGIYLSNDANETDGLSHPEYLALGACVVSNCFSKQNGAIYCDKGGAMDHITLVNNFTPTATDAAAEDASQTGGLYMKNYGIVVNSMLWNNFLNTQRVPMYSSTADGGSTSFYNTAIANPNNAVWNNTLMQKCIELSETNSTTSVNAAGEQTPPYFETKDLGSTVTNFASEAELHSKVGVQADWTVIDYYWNLKDGSNLRARGLPINLRPKALMSPSQRDLRNNYFDSSPSLGANITLKHTMAPTVVDGNVVLFVDTRNNEPENDGSSWKKPYGVIFEAAQHLSELTADEIDNILMTQDGLNKNEAIARRTADDFRLEVRVKAGMNVTPRIFFENTDYHTLTILLKASVAGCRIKLSGSWQEQADGTWAAHLINHRTNIDGHANTENDPCHHVITIDQGAKIDLENLHITNGMASTNANRPYGAGILIENDADVVLRNVIIENNMATKAAAIYGETGTKLVMENCVVNNNTNDESEPVVSCDEITLRHTSFIHNLGKGLSTKDDNVIEAVNALSAGNSSGNTLLAGSKVIEVNKTNFANPTKAAGRTEGFVTEYGGLSNFRPTTDNPVVNQGLDATDLTIDLAENARNLGGTPDLGAYEALLPEAGAVIYVTPDGAGKMDGSSWGNAIAGNLVYDMNLATDNGPMLVNGNTVTTTDSRYSGGFYIATSRPYGETSGHSRDFFGSLYHGDNNTVGANDGAHAFELITKWGVTRPLGYREGGQRYYYKAHYNITNTREEQYISGLQYAVEQATRSYNATTGKKVKVWVAGGVYTDEKGFVIRDHVDVYGGFPNEGTPGEAQRHPLVSESMPLRNEDEALKDEIGKYETILQVSEKSPVTWSNYNVAQVADWVANSPYTRKPVLYQPDVCLPTQGPEGVDTDGNMLALDKTVTVWTSENPYDIGTRDAQKQYIEYNSDTNPKRSSTDPSAKNYDKNYVEYDGAMWDGFTIRHGYYKNYKANRDGGAGVRVFENVTIQNCVIKDNYNYGSRSRGGGVYCDGKNTKIINSFIINNFVDGAQAFGGGMYQIVGTSYNLCVANNNAKIYGGGIYVEDASLYNNTIAYNKAGSAGGAVGQYTGSTDKSSLLIYNNIFYKNEAPENSNIVTTDINKFNGIYYSYVQGSSNIGSKIYNSKTGNEAEENPFAAGDNAQKLNDYRLKSGNWCVNHGTDEIPNVTLPATDVDFTDRIKDCTIDVGAYERNNSDNVKPETTTRTVNDVTFTDYTFYVTQNGAGVSSGENLENAACAYKLQEVLDAAGRLANPKENKYAIVKVAGYDHSENPFIYKPHTLADKNNPQSYSYVIPFGVTLKGGYVDAPSVTSWDTGKITYTQADGTEITTEAEWKEGVREPLKYTTVLKPEATLADGQVVNGFHCVTFGPYDATKATDTGTTGYNHSHPSRIDGVTLYGGQATALSVGDDTKGGGAIVPSYAHVRNCIVTCNTATYGGGLFVEPNGKVSGCLINDNTATYGAGIYVDNANPDGTLVDKDTRAVILSNSLVSNTASSSGGGIFVKGQGATVFNTTIWGNTAASSQNVSAEANITFEDTGWTEITTELNGLPNSGVGIHTKFYMFNDCHVERLGLPSNFGNEQMTSYRDTYFTGEDYELRPYSPLIKNGMMSLFYERLITKNDLCPLSLNGIARIQGQLASSYVDVGAMAYLGGIIEIDESNIIYRLFVSKSGARETPVGDVAQYIGRSFITPFSNLDEALEYIRRVRTNTETKDATLGKEFEIMMTQGTYTPTIRNPFATTTTDNQRQNTFVIPSGVSIYGGFKEDDIYSFDIDELEVIDGTVTKTLTLQPKDTSTPTATDEQLTEMLNARLMSDLNGNGLLEQWEMKEQTMLDGKINISLNEKNVYHVVYSSASVVPYNATYEGARVQMNGVTIRRGETLDYAAEESSTDEDEVGHGAGIYTCGIDYFLEQSRVLQNKGVRGNAVFVRGATFDTFGCLYAGNASVETTKAENLAGGVVYLSGRKPYEGTSTVEAKFHAGNCLFANNETQGQGAVIATTTGDNGATFAPCKTTIINCIMARNKAVGNYTIQADTAFVINTTMWNNELAGGLTEGDEISSSHNMTFHSASTRDLPTKAINEEGNEKETKNLKINTINMEVDGPRFVYPATLAGVEGYESTVNWKPAAISILVDAGDGLLDKQHTPATDGNYFDLATGLYKQMTSRLFPNDYKHYIRTDGYYRYQGPLDEEGNPDHRKIDIGLYEYQYRLNFNTMDKIYVATEDRGKADGSSWSDATSDLRGALVGASNAIDNTGVANDHKYVFVHKGNYDYAISQLFAGGEAFYINMTSNFSKHLHIKGAYNDNHVQDFSNPCLITHNPASLEPTKTLMKIDAHQRQVDIEGFEFNNPEGKGLEINTSEGLSTNGVAESETNPKVKGKVKVAYSKFMNNADNAVEIDKNNVGGILLVNTLFANNQEHGIYTEDAQAKDHIRVVNATFVKNRIDASAGDNMPTMVNTVAWENTTQNITTDKDAHNVAFSAGTPNNDVINGPNFIDPANDNYALRPSKLLLNKGNESLYVGFDGAPCYTDIESTAGDYTTPGSKDTERDLGNMVRFNDVSIDVGAYEYQVPLEPIIYVKQTNIAGSNQTGTSWSNATSDLQGAIDLAGLYAENNDGGNGRGYVMVDRDVKGSATTTVNLKNTMVYGNMFGTETTTATTTAEKVAELIGKRHGLMETTLHSTLQDLIISPTAETSVVDGFSITGNVKAENGYVSTSILSHEAADAKTLLGSKAVLYNSFVDGDVEKLAVGDTGTVVNVTATGFITANGTTSGNNRQATTDTDGNKVEVQTCDYVSKPVWKYQLNEGMRGENAPIDAGTNNLTETMMTAVGHQRDLAGNPRIILSGSTVDNGCMETWLFETKGTYETSNDGRYYPVDGSVVYVVSPGAKLVINHTEQPFKPGYLLLGSRSSLYGMGNKVDLSYLAIERDGDSFTPNDFNLFAVPYNIEKSGISVRTYSNGQTGELTLTPYTGSTYSYDSNMRAISRYEYYASNSKFWNAYATSTSACKGFTLYTDNLDGATLRFTGGQEDGPTIYSENGETYKTVTLTQYDIKTGTDGDFTYKENMGWNLVGMPWLVSQYTPSKMTLPKVMYGYNHITKQYDALQSWDDGLTTGSTRFGLGSSYFMQTATIGASETLKFEIPRPDDTNTLEANEEAYTLWIENEHDEQSSDAFVFRTTEGNTVESGYNLGADGIKWMAPNDSITQVYGVDQNRTRYAIKNTVGTSDEMGIGVRTLAGSYRITLGESADCSSADEVWLTDKATGQAVNLRTTDYHFTAGDSLDTGTRFTLSFKQPKLGASAIKVYTSAGRIHVDGCRAGDVINIYEPGGALMKSVTAPSRHASTPMQRGVFMVKVPGTSQAHKVRVQ